MGLRKLLRSHCTRINTKPKLYKTLLSRVLLYGFESCAVYKTDENKISIFVRKILRSIYGPIKVNVEWRTRWNHELYQIYKEPAVILEIKAKRVS